MIAALFGLHKCDKIRRFNRMKYFHRILVRHFPVYSVGSNLELPKCTQFDFERRFQAYGSVLLTCFAATWCNISFFYLATVIPETPNDNVFNIIAFWIWPTEIACLLCKLNRIFNGCIDLNCGKINFSGLLIHSVVSASLRPVEKIAQKWLNKSHT